MKKKLLIASAIIGIVLLFTNPNQNDFKSYLQIEDVPHYKAGRESYYLFFSIYITKYYFNYTTHKRLYIGILKNFIPLNNASIQTHEDSTLACQNKDSIEALKQAARLDSIEGLKNSKRLDSIKKYDDSLYWKGPPGESGVDENVLYNTLTDLSNVVTPVGKTYAEWGLDMRHDPKAAEQFYRTFSRYKKPDAVNPLDSYKNVDEFKAALYPNLKKK